MRRANPVRIVESDLNEHIRQENAAYRAIIRRTIEAERTSRASRKFVFLTDCIHSDADSIIAMTEAARPVTLRTFRKRCDSVEWERTMGYERRGGLPLSRDWHVGFYKSTYQGRPCY